MNNKIAIDFGTKLTENLQNAGINAISHPAIMDGKKLENINEINEELNSYLPDVAIGCGLEILRGHLESRIKEDKWFLIEGNRFGRFKRRDENKEKCPCMELRDCIGNFAENHNLRYLFMYRFFIVKRKMD